MSAGNIAYLVLVLSGYAVFILVLGVYWLRTAFGATKSAPPVTEVTPAHDPDAAGRRTAAS